MSISVQTQVPQEEIVTTEEHEKPPMMLFAPEDFEKKASKQEGENDTYESSLNGDLDTVPGEEKPRQYDIPMILPQSQPDPRGKFEVLQLYEGVVLSANNHSMWARLVNKTNELEEDEEAEFPLEEISYGDRKLIENGAVFYWYIGYYDSASGQRTRESKIRFRRLPALSDDVIKKARMKAEDIMKRFSGDQGDAFLDATQTDPNEKKFVKA